MYGIFHNSECKEIMKQKVINSSVGISDRTYLEIFLTYPYINMKYSDIFNKELHRLDIHNEIIKIITKDKNYLWNYYNDYKYIRKMAKERIVYSFKDLYNECTYWSQNKIKTIIMKEMKFNYFFDEEEFKNNLYESYGVNEILKEKNNNNIDEVLKYAFESQRGNQLLIIILMSFKKIEEKGFIEGLEKNYGVYLKVDEFMTEIKQKLNQIKSYKMLYEEMGSELGKDKTELEILMELYEKAKKKW